MSKASLDDVRAGLAAAAGAPWALATERAGAVTALIADLVRGRDVSPARLQAALAVGDHRSAAPQHTMRNAKGGMVAIVPVRGICLYDTHFPPFATGMRQLAATMNELAADASIAAIILDMATPGGAVTGTPEAAEAIYAAAKRKRVVAAVTPLAASAGYWLASQASDIMITPSGEVGSIGVYWLHIDFSRALDTEGITPTFLFAGDRKVDGNPLQPLSDRARADEQADINTIYRDFLKIVARGRNVSVGDVEKNFGQGRTFMAPEAVRRGMADKIGTFDQAAALLADTQRGARALVPAYRAELPTDPAEIKSEMSRTRLHLHRLEHHLWEIEHPDA